MSTKYFLRTALGRMPAGRNLLHSLTFFSGSAHYEEIKWLILELPQKTWIVPHWGRVGKVTVEFLGGDGVNGYKSANLKETLWRIVFEAETPLGKAFDVILIVCIANRHCGVCCDANDSKLKILRRHIGDAFTEYDAETYGRRGSRICVQTRNGYCGCGTIVGLRYSDNTLLAAEGSK